VERPAPGLVSVVIPVLNAAATLPRQLEALSRQTYREPWEIVVADNGSIDGTTDVARAFSDRFPVLTVVQAAEERGASYARNRGCDVARGDLIAFCDGDDVVTENWLEALVGASRRGDLIGGAVEPIAPGSSGLGSWPPLSSPREPRLGFLPFVSGASFAIWKNVLDDLGGMDERYPACQDVELSWRAQLASKTLVFEPRARVRYQIRETLGSAFRQHYVRGMAHVQLFDAYRRHGMPRMPGRAALAWGWLLLTAILAVPWRSHRELWIRRLGLRLGHLAGSVRYRSFYP
jgi:glycosyltransferase involved in cell wall biosynthesis